ncbi:MAG: disulfide isomerase, partial [Burkholderiales bacterium PBB4]
MKNLQFSPLSRALALALPLCLAACSKAPETAAAAPTTPATPASASAQAHAGIDWVKPDGASLDAIFAKAKADNKPVFLYWGAVWCPPCNQIKATVFNRPDFIAKSKAFVPVYLDGDTPGAQKLGTQFKVRGYPTTILFKPDGTELTRLPGEVDAVQYMQLLAQGLSSTQPIKETLAQALAKDAGAAPTLTMDAWRMLAYYSWETDESQLVPKKELAATLLQLAQKCPATYADTAARLMLKAAALSAEEKAAGLDTAAALAAVQSVVKDPVRARANADMLSYYAKDIVKVVTPKGSPERNALVADWNAALEKLVVDATLSKGDQLGAAQAKVDLTAIDGPADPKQPRDATLLTLVRDTAAAMDKSITDKYERQSVIPNAAHLLSDVGLLDESDAMLKAELPKAVSPYYHMLVLSSNAKKRGDTAGALDWAEKAYAGSIGPATRMQW